MRMLKHKPRPNADQLQKASALDDEAKRLFEKEEESFWRCDTDGFLSQWALNIRAQKYQKKAALLRDGGMARFPVLVDKSTGKVVATKIHAFKNKYGHGDVYKWKVEGYDRRWIPTGKNSRIQKQMGLEESVRWFEAEVKICGSGTGLSGCASAYVGVVMKE